MQLNKNHDGPDPDRTLRGVRYAPRPFHRILQVLAVHYIVSAVLFLTGRHIVAVSRARLLSSRTAALSIDNFGQINRRRRF